MNARESERHPGHSADHESGSIAEQLSSMDRRLIALEEHIEGISETLCRQLGDIRDILQLIYDDEPTNRLRLQSLRASDEYRIAYCEEEPLVSVVVPTYSGLETLRTVSLPSVLEQSYRNLEVLVVHDGSPYHLEISEIARGFDDDRVRVLEHPYNGPYPSDEFRRWLVTAAPPVNLAVSECRGAWVSLLSEDDSLRPEAISKLVEDAQSNQLEAAYGILLRHNADGSCDQISAFPPAHGQFGWQGAIYHAGLRFMQHELGDALFDQPSDWSLARRMLRAGVRFGMLDEVLADYFPGERDPRKCD